MRATPAAYAALEAVSASATRAGDVREWEHVRFLGRGDAAIEAECDRRIAAIEALAVASSSRLDDMIEALYRGIDAYEAATAKEPTS